MLDKLVEIAKVTGFVTVPWNPELDEQVKKAKYDNVTFQVGTSIVDLQTNKYVTGLKVIYNETVSTSSESTGESG